MKTVIPEKKIRGVYERVMGSGVWWICYFDADGKRRREKVGSKKAAMSAVESRRTKAREGIKVPQNLRAVVRVADLAPALARDYRVNEKKSIRSVEHRLRKHVLPFFASMKADNVSTDDINRYIDARRTAGAANGTINRELAALKRIYNLARTGTPPKVRDVPVFPHLKESAPRKGFVEDRQYDALTAGAGELWLRAILAVAYTFGFRRSELLSLKVRQVDLLARTIHLEVGATKNGEGRTVKMTHEVWELLAQCVQGKGPDDHVFTRSANEPVLDFRAAWASLTTAAELPGLLFHDLRRSAVRNMVRRGVPETVAMKISGHKTRSVFDRYDVTSGADLEQAAARIEAGRARQTEQASATTTATSPVGASEPVAHVVQ
jgi:integrase